MIDSLMVHNQKIEVEWHCWGQRNHPTLVFLHEGLGCVSLWKDFPSQLSRLTRCNAFVFSRLGHGKSDPCLTPRKINFMHSEARNFLPAVLQAAKIGNHIIIGHSDGGSIGLINAGSPGADRLNGLITEAAHVFCEPLTTEAIKLARHNFLNQDLKKRLEKYHGPNTDHAFWGWNNVWLHPKFIHWNIQKFLSRIKVPVMALQGRQDPYGTPAQLAAIAAGVKDCNAHLIDQCSHSPHKDQQETVLASMARFINTISAASTQS